MLAIFMSYPAHIEAGQNAYAAAIAAYWETKFDLPASNFRDLRVVGVRSLSLPCPGLHRCTSTSYVHLVTWSQADEEGEALVFSGPRPRCAGCIAGVANAGGGSMSAADLVSFGLTKTQADMILDR